MADPTLAWRVEETCLNAWPALRQALFRGWLLRFSEGLSRRVNSVNPISPDCRDIEVLIPACEALYHRQRLPAIFRVLSLIEPALDQTLAARGYAREGDSCVLYGAIDMLDAARDPEVQLFDNPPSEWFAAMAALQSHTPEQSRTYRHIVGQVSIPAAFAALPVDGEIGALAYGAMHDGLLCVESVVTNPARLRRGYAGRVIRSLGAWARARGAEGVCLEVETTNAPARALYDRLGLKTELYRYHYRREPQSALH